MEQDSTYIKSCDICGINSSCICFSCLNYFCDSCFTIIHDKEKNSCHKKEEINPYIPIELKCEKHPKNPLNLFCINEKGTFINIIFL